MISNNKISQAGDIELVEGGHAKNGPDGRGEAVSSPASRKWRGCWTGYWAKKCGRLNLKSYARFFDLTFSDDKDRVLLACFKNNKAIDDYIRYCGYYCIISTERIQSVEALRSKIFIEFIALILRSRLHHTVNGHVPATGRRPNYMNVVSALGELEKIKLIRIGDGVDDIKDRCRALSRTLAAMDNRHTEGGSPESDVRDDSAVETEEEV